MLYFARAKNGHFADSESCEQNKPFSFEKVKPMLA